MHLPAGPELWIILAIVVLLFGAKKIPELGKSLGQGIKEFKKSTKVAMEEEEEEKKESANSAS